MGSVVVAIAIVAGLAAAFNGMGLIGAIAMIAGGGVGFAIGDMAGSGWAIFGAILGGLVGIAAAIEGKKKAHHE